MFSTRRTPNFTLPILIALLAGAPAAMAELPTADALIEKATQAMGGKAAIDKITSYMSTSDVSSPMGVLQTEVYWGNPKRVLAKRMMTGMGEMQAGSDGTIGWMNMPGMGYSLVEGPSLQEIQEQATHVRILHLRELVREKYDLGAVSEATFDEAACYGLAFKSKKKEDGEAGTMYFDVESGLMRGMQMDAGGTSANVMLRDWKPVEKVKLFRLMEIASDQMSMMVAFKTIELNKVDPAVFAVPDEVKALVENKPAGGDEKVKALEDFTPQMQAMIADLIDKMPKDLAELQSAKTTLEGQIGKIPGEFGEAMKYVLSKMSERIKELGG